MILKSSPLPLYELLAFLSEIWPKEPLLESKKKNS